MGVLVDVCGVRMTPPWQDIGAAAGLRPTNRNVKYLKNVNNLPGKMRFKQKNGVIAPRLRVPKVRGTERCHQQGALDCRIHCGTEGLRTQTFCAVH